VISIKNVTFDPNPGKSEEVGTGEKRKSPFARIKGELHHMTEDEAVQHMVDNLHHPDYAQVGYDPRRHGHFYDRKTLQPVTHSPHVVQIGPLALAHKPTYGKRENYAKGGEVSREEPATAPESDLLSHPNKSYSVGAERLLHDAPDLKIAQAKYSPTKAKSYRYLSYQNNEPVGVLQFMTDAKNPKSAVIQNAYVKQALQKQGIGSALLARARQDFDLRHSDELSEAGKAFAARTKAKGGLAHMAGGSIEYQGEHKPPSESYGAPLHDLTQVYPEDIYSNKALQYYGMGHPEHKKMDMESLFKAQMYRDKPNASVSVFRAVPEHINEINPKDWVTLSPAYAKLHGESRLGGKYKTLKKMVKAKELWTAGDSIHEWGYHPEEKKAAGGRVKPVGYTKEQVTVSPNLDAMRYELMSVKQYTKKVK
jgi:predicted GNAT family acetyltransferase